MSQNVILSMIRLSKVLLKSQKYLKMDGIKDSKILYTTHLLFMTKRDQTLLDSTVYIIAIHEALMCSVKPKSVADKHLLRIKIAALMTDLADLDCKLKNTF